MKYCSRHNNPVSLQARLFLTHRDAYYAGDFDDEPERDYIDTHYPTGYSENCEDFIHEVDVPDTVYLLAKVVPYEMANHGENIMFAFFKSKRAAKAAAYVDKMAEDYVPSDYPMHFIMRLKVPGTMSKSMSRSKSASKSASKSSKSPKKLSRAQSSSVLRNVTRLVRSNSSRT